MSVLAQCLWPGLSDLWFRGHWSGLLRAVVFAAALNIVLLFTFVPLLRLPPWLVLMGWVGLIAVWSVSAAGTYRRLRDEFERGGGDERGLFLQAQGEYLRGHWYEAESLLKQLLGPSSGDVDALLMLASLYRRTRRPQEAQRRLQAIERTEGGEKWRWEIERERLMLKRAADSDREDTRSTSSS